MHSLQLLALNKQEIPKSTEIGLGTTFEVAGWLKLKRTHDLPALLVLELSTVHDQLWYLVDTARAINSKGVVLMSGRIETKETQINELTLYLCHPNPDISVEVEELRFNGDLVRKDYIEGFSATG